MSNAHSSQVARLKALKAELEELNSPTKALGGDYDDVEALNKAKEELQREKEQCEQLRNEKDETNAELGRLRVEISASKQDATSPLSLHQVQAATRKLEAEIADCNAALKEAQKKEQQRSAEVMKLRSQLIRSQQEEAPPTVAPTPIQPREEAILRLEIDLKREKDRTERLEQAQIALEETSATDLARVVGELEEQKVLVREMKEDRRAAVEARSPVKQPDSMSANSKLKQELARQEHMVEELEDEVDEKATEIKRLKALLDKGASAEIPPSPATPSPLPHQADTTEATSLQEERDRLYQEVVALAEDKKHLMEESQIASEQAALLLMDKLTTLEEELEEREEESQIEAAACSKWSEMAQDLKVKLEQAQHELKA